ncbi:response regulator transcription factor [Pyruvatibacter sp.]|uniref:response regulator transcription factor n=1 Tax=Pyruvatibacter sp. TaxID=1981328 RepID=UPI0032ED6F83
MTDRQIRLADDAPHLLVVDDDRRIRELLKKYLADNGFRVTTAQDAAQARSRLEGLAFDLIVLDVMMPGESGVTFATRLRVTSDVPVLMLTARTEAENRIEGLEAGADDYLPKPFEPRELLLRIRTILKRANTRPQPKKQVTFGDLTFDIERGILTRNDTPVRLTTRETDLMTLFARAAGRALPREELTGGDPDISDRAVDVQINRLRRKIEPNPKDPRYLRTIRGEGYMFICD